MIKRLLLLIVVVAAGLLVLLSWNRTTHRIDLESFTRIKAGMTKDAVEVIFKCGPGDHGSTPIGMCDDGTVFPLEHLHTILDSLHQRSADHQSQIWVSDECVILVYFNDRDIVTYSAFQSRSQSGIVPRGPSDTFWKKARRFLGLA